MRYIRAMNLTTLDLNLLVALDALLSEASVGRAAMRIGLSQPATSHALRRLRQVMADPLLVRAGMRMELTPRAQALRAPLAQALDQVRALLVAEGFSPSTSTRRFVLMMPDLVVDLVMPALIERVAESAPHVRLDVVPWRRPTAANSELTGSIDVIIACLPDAFAGFHRRRLYTDSDVLAVRRDYPNSRRLRRLQGFVEARHVAVVGPGAGEDMIDAWLRENGLERRIALVVPSYLQALHVVARTDLVAFVPSRLIAALAGPLSLIAVAPPIDPGIDEQYMFYPTRAQVDPGSIWLRNLVAQIGRDLDGGRQRGPVPRANVTPPDG